MRYVHVRILDIDVVEDDHSHVDKEKYSEKTRDYIDFFLPLT